MVWERAERDIDWLRERVDIDPVTGCWEWKLTRDRVGRGQYSITICGEKTITRKAHALAFELRHGRPPLPGNVIRHSCDNPPCANADHLVEGSQADNVTDMMARGRCGRIKLSGPAIAAILDGLARGRTGASLAREFGVSETRISGIKHGKFWAGRLET